MTRFITETPTAVSPDCSCRIGGVCQNGGCAYFGERIPAGPMDEACEGVRNRWPYRAVGPWPRDCYNQDKCRQIRKCLWGLGDNLCAHQDRDIAPEVTANTTLTLPQMRAELARQVREAGGICAAARAHRLTHSSASLAVSGQRPVTEELANACGYVAEMTFRKI